MIYQKADIKKNANMFVKKQAYNLFFYLYY